MHTTQERKCAKLYHYYGLLKNRLWPVHNWSLSFTQCSATATGPIAQTPGPATTVQSKSVAVQSGCQSFCSPRTRLLNTNGETKFTLIFLVSSWEKYKQCGWDSTYLQHFSYLILCICENDFNIMQHSAGMRYVMFWPTCPHQTLKHMISDNFKWTQSFFNPTNNSTLQHSVITNVADGRLHHYLISTFECGWVEYVTFPFPLDLNEVVIIPFKVLSLAMARALSRLPASSVAFKTSSPQHDHTCLCILLVDQAKTWQCLPLIYSMAGTGEKNA